MILHKIFEVMIIASLIDFVGIIRHSIILCSLATCCIEHTVHSIRYFIMGEKIGLLFCPVNW